MQTDFTQLAHRLGPTVSKDGQSYLYFGGTAYLGIPGNEAFIRFYTEGIQLFGLNNGTSRSNNVQLGIYDEIEAYTAARFRAAAALTTSSGFLAAQLIIKQFARFGQIRHAPGTHPALWLDEPPVVKGTFTTWAEAIVAEINSSGLKRWFLISNSMNNLFPELYDFSFIEKIHPEKEVLLLIDDSHGIGVNNDGLSALSGFQAPPHVKVILIASMAKALGVDAGLILGDAALIQELKSSNAFLGASPPSAAGLYAFKEGLQIYERELVKLKKLSTKLGNALKNNDDWHFIPGFPVFLSKNAELSQNLLRQQILVSAFPYPDKDGEVINRIVLSSWHTEEDVDTLISSLNSI